VRCEEHQVDKDFNLVERECTGCKLVDILAGNNLCACRDSASTASSLVFVGTVHLAVQASGAAPVTGEIIELITVVLATGARRSYGGVDLVAGQGVAVAGTGRRLQGSLALAPPPRRHLQATCTDECDADGGAVMGDVSGDCQFTLADVLELQLLVSDREAYLAGREATDPLDALCAWRRRQANPSLDVRSGGGNALVAGAAPKITLEDAQHLLFAVAKKHCFVHDLVATCIAADGAYGGGFSLLVHVRAAERGDSPGATPDQTDVRIELKLVDEGNGAHDVGRTASPLTRGRSPRPVRPSAPSWPTQPTSAAAFTGCACARPTPAPAAGSPCARR